jgi:hypothetical protein
MARRILTGFGPLGALLLAGCLAGPDLTFDNPCDPARGGACDDAAARRPDVRRDAGVDAVERDAGPRDARGPAADALSPDLGRDAGPATDGPRMDAGSAPSDALVKADSGERCEPAAERRCPADLPDAGACRAGVETCQASGRWGPCEGATAAAAETCDEVDNDCDGEVDEDTDIPCWEFDPVQRGVGACTDGVRTCVLGVYSGCEGAVGPEAERCDGLDNDCDGVADQYSEPCYEGDPATIGPGLRCHGGLHVCQVGAFTACMGQLLPGAETCNSQDDDCDGSVDEDFDFASDPLHCGGCDGVCAAGERCCHRGCRALNTRQDCGGCGVICDAGADACLDPGDGSPARCVCGDGPACVEGLECIGGACRCRDDADCGDDGLCCGGECTPTSAGPGGQCAACDDGGCDPDTAETCTRRECRCGDNAACAQGFAICADGPPGQSDRCTGCESNGQCGADERCCGGVCVGTNPDSVCEACDLACDPLRADRCRSISDGLEHEFTCTCGAADTPCDSAGPTPFCIGGVCEACRDDADCSDGARSQCVDHVCRPCDPADHEGCGPDALCCGFACHPSGPASNQQCEACGQACEASSSSACAARRCGCGAGPECGGAAPHCDDPRGVCVECLNDADCAADPDGQQCIQNVCRVCDPVGHDGCGPNQVCCGAGQPGLYRCELTGPGDGDQCEACDAVCDTTTTNRCADRTCGCGGGPPCGGATPVCDDAQGQCVQCVMDADCAGIPSGGQCVANVCRPCDPADHGGCGQGALCCNFQCEASSAGGQCEACGTPCPSTADTCSDRNCVCGAGPGAVECGGAMGLCVGGACVACRNNDQCGPNELCCNGACQADRASRERPVPGLRSGLHAVEQQPLRGSDLPLRQHPGLRRQHPHL